MEENEKKELALQIIDRLKKAYPDADCTLDYDDAWKKLQNRDLTELWFFRILISYFRGKQF